MERLNYYALDSGRMGQEWMDSTTTAMGEEPRTATTMASAEASTATEPSSKRGGSEDRNNELPIHDKNFACSHPGCKKRFTRAEHLQRHALNHTPGGLACTVCSANFKRPDLLKRHMDRHRQKDLEAGGPGCGTLDTRKRAWRAPDGSVVDKRPCRDPASKTGARQHSQQKTQQQPSPDPEPTQADLQLHQQPSSFEQAQRDIASSFDASNPSSALAFLPPPPQQPAVGRNGSCSISSESVESYLDYYEPSHTVDVGSSYENCWDDQLQNSIFDPALFNNSLEYEQIFQPDTASSFNMPYTTALDYNWLFNSKTITVPDPKTKDITISSPEDQRAPVQQGQYGLSPESMNSSQLWPETADPRRMETSDAGIPRSVSLDISSASNPTSRPAQLSPDVDTRNAITSRPRPEPPTSHIQRRRTAIHHSPAPELERPFSTIQNHAALPPVSEQVRDRLLSVIESANPSLPDPRVSIWEDPLLSVTSFQTYLDLYFTRFNTAYPLIHLPTFNPEETEPLLLLSVLLLGATYSGKDAHQLAVCIHDVIRPSIFAHAGFSPQPKLWTLQTILLVECFGKSRAGQRQHDMSHLFHGLLINLIRRSDCQSVKPVGPPPEISDGNSRALRESWERWAVAEQKKRLALLCFMWDTQHAVLFCQSLCMSAFELRLEMPCSQSIWESADPMTWASSWRASHSSSHNVSYLASLKSFLTPGSPRPVGLSALSRVLVLHGLMSVAWDMQRRDQTALGVVSGTGPREGWRKIISSAYDAWKTDFDAYCAAITARSLRAQSDNPHEEAQRVGFAAFAAAYSSLYHSVQILLNMDFLDVQIYAGARNILGRPVQQRDYLRSAQVVKSWAASEGRVEEMAVSPSSRGAPVERPGHSDDQNPRVAAWHAGRMLHEHAGILADSDAMSLFHVPWCMYLVTLTCWAYHHARPARARDRDAGEAGDDADEIVWDPKGEMESLVATMAEWSDQSDQGRKRTNGLVWTMAETLTKVRWGIVHAGVVVLRGLVPQRLINQYDEPAEWSVSGR